MSVRLYTIVHQSAKVILNEKQRLSRVNIRIAPSLKVASALRFYLIVYYYSNWTVYVSDWWWSYFSILRCQRARVAWTQGHLLAPWPILEMVTDAILPVLYWFFLPAAGWYLCHSTDGFYFFINKRGFTSHFWGGFVLSTTRSKTKIVHWVYCHTQT